MTLHRLVAVSLILPAVVCFAAVAQADVAPPNACFDVGEACSFDAGGAVDGVCTELTCVRAGPDGPMEYACFRCVLPGPDAGSSSDASLPSSSDAGPTTTGGWDASSSSTLEVADGSTPTMDPIDGSAAVDGSAVHIDASHAEVDASSNADGDASATTQTTSSTSTTAADDASVAPTNDAGAQTSSDTSDTTHVECSCSLPGRHGEHWLSGVMLSAGFLALLSTRRSSRQ